MNWVFDSALLTHLQVQCFFFFQAFSKVSVIYALTIETGNCKG